MSRLVNRSRHRVQPKELAAQIMREFPYEPHAALERMKAIRGADAIPDSYWQRVTKEISALAKRKRVTKGALCTCRTEGKRSCPEHGSPDADA